MKKQINVIANFISEQVILNLIFYLAENGPNEIMTNRMALLIPLAKRISPTLCIDDNTFTGKHRAA